MPHNRTHNPGCKPGNFNEYNHAKTQWPMSGHDWNSLIFHVLWHSGDGEHVFTNFEKFLTHVRGVQSGRTCTVMVLDHDSPGLVTKFIIEGDPGGAR